MRFWISLYGKKSKMGSCLQSGDAVKQPVKILPDTGSAQSFILEGVLPLFDTTDDRIGDGLHESFFV
jgi:hypothetical protein